MVLVVAACTCTCGLKMRFPDIIGVFCTHTCNSYYTGMLPLREEGERGVGVVKNCQCYKSTLHVSNASMHACTKKGCAYCIHVHTLLICDRLRENPAYGINAQVAQCAFLVPRVKNCQTSDFVISMSNNPSTNCYRWLRRLNVSFKGEISRDLQAFRTT